MWFSLSRQCYFTSKKNLSKIAKFLNQSSNYYCQTEKAKGIPKTSFKKDSKQNHNLS